MTENTKEWKADLGNAILTEVNKLEGLANLFDLAADGLDPGKRQLNYLGIIGIGEILASIAGNLGKKVSELQGAG